jgi:hypothetical protein
VAQGVIICVGSFGPGPDWVRGKSMLTCPNCHAGVPEEMRFCLQCGASVAPTPPPAAPPVAADPPMPAAPAPPAPVSARPEPPHKGTSTVPLKIAPTPVVAPRDGAPTGHERPSLGDQTEEVDDESLKKSFLRPVTQVGAVICRFCKGPLDLDGDFCEQCGAPVAEAAPPGMIKPKPQHPATPPATPALPPSKPGQAASPGRPPVGSAPARYPGAAPPLPAKPPVRTDPTRPAPTRTAPAAPTSPPTPPAEEQPSGFMGRLKGLFKKG